LPDSDNVIRFFCIWLTLLVVYLRLHKLREYDIG